MARVLITDDAAFMRMMIKNILVQHGHEVVGEAANGVEAVSQYTTLKPDITTMDITMPEKDGIQALKDILVADPGARVVMCSALGQEAKVIESIRAGAKDFIVKPFQPERVLSAIEKALGA
jgi:two-component system chemotaxis response regulator CheY